MAKRKIRWMHEKSIDLLIFDGEGLENLKFCLPPKATYAVIRNRVEIPLVFSPIFFIKLCSGIAIFRSAKLALLYALISTFKPKIILSIIDNSPTLSLIHRIFPDVPIFVVQNGVRWDFSRPNKDAMKFDHYFAFGLVEADIFKEGGHEVKNYHPVGSVRAGIFRAKEPELIKNKFDLCLISQFDPIPHNISKLDAWSAEVFTSYYSVSRELYKLILQYSVEKNLNLCIAMRHSKASEAFESEINFYSEFISGVPTFIPQHQFSSYEAVQQSELIFSISSSLSYEALGWGKRVIFGKDIKKVRDLVTKGSWKKNYATCNLPDFLRLFTTNYDELSLKADKLFSMNEKDYQGHIQDARSYYMTFDSKKFAHEIIKQEIEKNLKINRNI
jgi:surface carbohydrate biosynthesis protein